MDENIKTKSIKIRNYHPGYPKGYGDAGASLNKKSLKGFEAKSGSPQEDIDYNNHILRQRARMLYMAAPIATSAIKTCRTNVIGIGLIPKSRIDYEYLGITREKAESKQKELGREWRLWAEDKRNCDATGINDFYSMQQLALTSALMSGDSYALVKRYERKAFAPYSLRLHILEADRISTPDGLKDGLYQPKGIAENGNKIHDGVEIDKNGLIQAYYIRNYYPDDLDAISGKDDWIKVPAYGENSNSPNIFHLMETERPDQYRGVTYLAQIIEPLLQLRRYTESELMAALVNSFFTAFIETEAEASDIPFNSPQEDIPDDLSEDEYAMGPGFINIMKPGEKVSFGDPKHPNSGFEKFALAVIQQCGASLEIPADMLMKAFNASYSASRAALLEAWKMFKMRRSWFISDFCDPTWELFVDEAVALGRIKAPGYFSNPLIRKAYLGCEWIGPSQGQLDPVKEITAEILACQNGFSSREQSTIKLNGGDFDQNVSQLGSENPKLYEAIANATSVVNITINDDKENPNGKN